ncbi:hypothetical protein [Cryobacterium sp. GrIS_2_6]|uniref:hypothetical protein n=1 Tax=Cryobacterium sp. GrIS_2_6 TaxID=3162785 RepID=UPI002E0261ED|nr:hypothetical protein [Cryobacterium psychrotolerans]MEC5149279.1 hypothetical protein [Cryobacterium psychrotolerans]MEC5149358.1 hypothetical protein [Cryobacterium psychrotolerans]
MDTVPTITGADTTRARESDPLTSHAAADSNTNRVHVKAAVLRLITGRPMTDEQLTAAYFAELDYVPADLDSPRKRRSELTKDGVIEASGVTATGRSNRQVNVWRVTS